MASKPAFPGTPPISAALVLTSADNGQWRTLYSSPADGNGSLAGRMRGVSNDSSHVELMVARVIGGSYQRIGYLSVPAGAGCGSAVPWKDLLEDLNSGESMALAPGEALSVLPATNITEGKTCWLHLEGAPL